MEKKLHYQYVMLQCSFYAMSACFIGYMVPVLQTQGFNHTQIGFFLALRALFSVIFQPIIANVMDKFKSVISFNQLIAVMIIISMMMTGVQILNPGFFGMTFIFMMYGMVTYGMVSFIDAMSTLYFYKGQKINYPVARGAGSLSYAISALLVGLFVAPERILVTQFFLFFPLLFFILKIDCVKGADATHHESENQSFSYPALLRAFPFFKLFLIAIIFSFIGKELSSSFLIDVYRSLGGNNRDYGLGTFLLAASEIPAAIIFTRLADRLGIYRLMLLSFFFAFLRIFLIMLAPNLLLLNIAQMMQMLGNGLFWAGNIQFIRTILPAKDAVKAQAAVGVCYLGIGSGVGSLLSGVILEATNLTTLLATASFFSLIGFFILLSGQKYERSADSLGQNQSL